jgi:hypothetical protein
MKFGFLQGAALLGACVQAYFALKEIFGWGRKFVDKAAPAWIDPKDPNTDAHIDWARHLARNMGVYNLVLAIGLAWTVFADASIAGSLGFYFSAWLLIAAGAAWCTKVKLAAASQGVLGLLLLMATIWSRSTPV